MPTGKKDTLKNVSNFLNKRKPTKKIYQATTKAKYQLNLIT